MNQWPTNGLRLRSPTPGALDYSFSCHAEWYVIHAGQERGPFSFAELVGKAALGEIAADDLVKQTGGLWTKGARY